MVDDRRDARSGDYRGARIGAAAALTFVVVVLLLVDAFSPDYETSPLVLVTVLGTVLTLLGREARDIIKGGGA